MGILDEKSVLREVRAHAMLSSLGAHSNVVRYYSVWKEDNHLFIQNELCDLGPLSSFHDFDEKMLLDILKQTLEVRFLASVFFFASPIFFFFFLSFFFFFPCLLTTAGSEVHS